MRQEGRLPELVASIKKAYGSLDDPQYFFMEKRYQSLLCHPFVLDVMSMYFVKNETDLNDHVSLHLEILHKDGRMLACLSFVDNWAMLFRLEVEGEPQVRVLDASSVDTLPAESDVVRLLSQYAFKLISRKEAATPIEMNLCDTDKSEARVYHAIVSDDGTIPPFLLGNEEEERGRESQI